MQPNIDLYILSYRSKIKGSTKTLLQKENNIHLNGSFKTLKAALYFFSKNTKIFKNARILLFDDYSFKIFETVKFLIDFNRMNHTQILLYTSNTNAYYLKSVFELKVNGILHKNDTPISTHGDKLIAAIKFINKGMFCCDVTATDLINKLTQITRPNFDESIMAEAVNNSTSHNHQVDIFNPFQEDSSKVGDPNLKSSVCYGLGKLLTKREREILQMIADEQKNNEIAKTLSVSADTISQHKVHIIKKLGLSSAVQLSHFAFRYQKEILKQI